MVSCQKTPNELKNPLKINKTLYTLEQIELIICEHRESSYLFKCNFEYAKIDIRSDLEENKRKTICNDKSLDPNNQCQALRNQGCNPYQGLKYWCNNRKVEIEDQRMMWHKAIGITCHKNLKKHTELCKNGKNKKQEGDKHISPAEIDKLYRREKEHNLKKPTPLVDESKPKKKPINILPITFPKLEKTLVVSPSVQLLINYIFGEDQGIIERENLILFISHVFEENDKSQNPIKPLTASIGHGKDKVKRPAFQSHSKPIIVSDVANSVNRLFIEHVLNEGKPSKEKPILPAPFYNIEVPSKTKVNKRLTELLLDYIFDLSRPLDYDEDLKLLVENLFRDGQRFIDESKLRTILVEIIAEYKPLIHVMKPVAIQSIQHPEKPKTQDKIVQSEKPHYLHNIEPPGNLGSLGGHKLLQNLQHFLSDKLNKTSKLIQIKHSKDKPVAIPMITRDEFDVSFIFKIADELLTPRDHDYYHGSSDSNLKHYNFLVGHNKVNKNSEIAKKDSKIKKNENDLKEIFTNKKSLIGHKQSSIDDLMNSMNI